MKAVDLYKLFTEAEIRSEADFFEWIDDLNKELEAKEVYIFTYLKRLLVQEQENRMVIYEQIFERKREDAPVVNKHRLLAEVQMPSGTFGEAKMKLVDANVWDVEVSGGTGTDKYQEVEGKILKGGKVYSWGWQHE